jgi:GNAT superfamily N-acetyltransferase
MRPNGYRGVMHDELRIEPMTPERWSDLEALFGRGGASYGCWCMFFRRTSAEMATARSADNRADLRRLAGEDPAPGLLAYDEHGAVGWVGLGPRAGFARLVRSRNLKAVDDLPAWSVVCFYVARRRRGETISRALLEGAVAYARDHGAPVIEGYARDTGDMRLSAESAYTGTVSLFARAGFHEVARYLPPGGATARVTMRRDLAAI